MHQICDIKINKETLIIFSDSGEFYFNLRELSPLLKNASDLELNNYQVSPSKYGIHWKLLDEDISLQALITQSLKENLTSN